MHKQWQEMAAMYESLSAIEQSAVEQHVQGCMECAALFATYQQMDRKLAALPRPEPPPDLRSGFYARLDAEAGRRSFPWLQGWQQISRFAGQGAALILLIAVVGIMWLSVRQRPFQATAVISVSKPTLTPTATPIPTSTPTSIPTVASPPELKAMAQPTIQGTRAAIESIAAVSDGQLLALGLGNRQVQLWQTERGELTRYWIMPNLTAESVALSADGRWLAAGSADYQGYVMRWAATGTDEEIRLDEPDDTVSALAFSPDSSLLAAGTGQEDGQVYLWQMDDNHLRHRLKAGAGIRALAFSADGRYLAVGTTGGTVQIWQVAAAELIETVTFSAEPVTVLSFSGDGQMIAAGTADGRLQLYTLASGDLLPVIDGETAVQDVAMNAEATLISAIFADGEWRLWQLTDEVPVLLYATHVEPIANFRAKLLFAEDRLQLIAANSTGSIQIWHIQPN